MNKHWNEEWESFMSDLTEYTASLAHRELQRVLYSDGIDGLNEAKRNVEKSSIWRNKLFRRLMEAQINHLYDYRRSIGKVRRKFRDRRHEASH